MKQRNDEIGLQPKAAYWRKIIYQYLEKQEYGSAIEAARSFADLPVYRCEALSLLTSSYIEAGMQAEARQASNELLLLAPQEAYALFLQARIHFMAGERIQLIPALKYALQKGRHMQPAYQEKIYNLLGQCYRYMGDSLQSTAAYLKASAYAGTPELKAVEYSNYLFNLHYLPAISPMEIYKKHMRYNQFFDTYKQFMHRRRCVGKKLRIGYISPDFRDHVVLRFSYALLQYYTREMFDVYCYAKGSEDEYSRQAAALVDGWRNIASLSSAEAAQLIYEDEIDVLVDLSGHTNHNCLPIMAYKPAPVQISGIGYFATTGLKAIDYFLGDSYIDTERDKVFFTEHLVRLPHSHFCYTPLSNTLPVQGAPCKRTGYITFASFNNFTKVTDRVLSAWAKILQRVPQAKLFLKAAIFDSDEGREYVLQRLQKQGIDRARVIMRGFSRDYLAEYYAVDIALDTYPYPGGGTTCDALFMGVPVVTLQGENHGARFGYSIMKNAGLEEFCADTVEAYVEKAVVLAGDWELLDALHRSIRQILQASPLMDGAGYMREVEKLYTDIWQKFCISQPIPAYRDISRLLPIMKKFAAQNDLRQALAAADAILAAKPDERYVLETLLEIYIDAQDLERAQKTADLLQKGSEMSGYDWFLFGRVAYLGHVLDKAENFCLSALQMPDLASWQHSVVHNLLGGIYKDMGNPAEAARHYLEACQCGEELAEKAADYSNYLFTLHYLSYDRAFMYEAAKKYNALFCDIQQYVHKREERHTKLRIGYISPDIRFHVVAFFSYAFFKNYDHERFEVSCYANCEEDAASLEFAAAVDHWYNIRGVKAAEVAERIYKDEIDILVDLAGHTKDNCLPVLAYKPAPVQICGVGYFNTTGLDTVDYFLTDNYLDPQGQNDRFFTEKLLRLPQSHFCYMWHDAPGASSPAPYRMAGHITFGCFNNFTKVTDDMLNLWSQILFRLPDAWLFLKSSVFDHEYSRKAAIARIQKQGIPMDRVRLDGYSVPYLQEYAQVDIALDTFPYPGGGTTCDALYMGVPVITLVGTSHNARFGYSLLKNIGLEECCAFSLEEYVELTVRLAEDQKQLRYLHQILRRRMRQSPVMQADAYMAEIENLYSTVWQSWILGHAPAEEQDARVKKDFQVMLAALPEKNWESVVLAAGRLVCRENCPVQVLSAMGFAYGERRNFGRAAYWLCRAVACDVENRANLYMLLGEALQEQMDPVGAAAAFEAAEKADEGRREEFQAQALVRQAALLRVKPIEAAAKYLAAGEHADDFQDQCNLYSSYLLTLHYAPVCEDALFKAQEKYHMLFQGIQPYTHGGRRRTHKKLRIGYISPDFRKHVMFSFYYALLACYDHQNFEVYCYQMNKTSDGYTKALVVLVDVWKNIAKLSYEKAAAVIYEDEIDLLIDLAGHSAHSGLPILAWKPAAVQLSGLGYMSTTGLPAVDYFITDGWVDPPGLHEKYFSEKLLRLPSQFCYTGRSDVGVSEGAPCCQRGYILFGVFNHYYKITDDMLRIWQKIMLRLPAAKILFKCHMMGSDSAVDQVYERMCALEFDMDRIIFEPSSVDYMERYLDVDIALDTYPYPGGGTTCDALYMGVPVVSLYGSRRGSRFGLSILQSIGLGELAVDTDQAYIERTVALTQDRELLNMLHKNLRSMMVKSRLMDSTAYVRGLEEKYLAIWQNEAEER